MNKLLKRLISPIYKHFIGRIIEKDRMINLEGLDIMVKKGVFHPSFFFSTGTLLDFLKTVDLKNRTLLELGCGSGAISLYAASAGADVTASDISPLVIEALIENADRNQLDLQIYLSDLFEEIPLTEFEYIIINPPYYPKNPENMEQRAWFCGENFEYFKGLFSQLEPYFNADSHCLMILSEDCDVSSINNIARKHGLVLEEMLQVSNWWEENTVFKVEKVGW